MSLTAALSGPERTRAKAEIALEDARIPILPDDHHAVMGWPAKLPQLPSGKKPKVPHGFITVLVADADQLNHAVALVEKAGWVLRVHYETPPAPEPTVEQTLAASVAEMRAEIDAMRTQIGGGAYDR